MTDTRRHFSNRATERCRRFRKTLRGLAVLCALVVPASCEDGPNNSPTPVPPAPRLLQQGDLAIPAPTEDGFYFALASIASPAAGQWEATVDWGNDANTLWMWVAEGACTVEQFARPDCPLEVTCPCRFAIRSETTVPKPRVLAIPGAASGTRTLIVGNLGPLEDTARYRVMLTTSNANVGASAQTIGLTSGASSGVSTGRKTRLARP